MPARRRRLLKRKRIDDLPGGQPVSVAQLPGAAVAEELLPGLGEILAGWLEEPVQACLPNGMFPDNRTRGMVSFANGLLE